jgi:hypothetical protein
VKLPSYFCELRDGRAGVNASVLRIAAKHGVLREDWRTKYKRYEHEQAFQGRALRCIHRRNAMKNVFQ